jgi:hypothetical protein
MTQPLSSPSPRRGLPAGALALVAAFVAALTGLALAAVMLAQIS